jgi:DNA repair protein RadA/Sms
MAKTPSTIYVCSNCGGQQRKWHGRCPDCGEFNTLVEERFRPTPQPIGKVAASATSGTRLTSGSYRETKPIFYGDIESQDDARTSSGIEEFDRVLGGGIVAGSLVLIGGAPGIGKSTLVIQVADKLSATNTKVLYVSGEESEKQIKMRGERLGVNAENLYLLPETNLENILAETERLQPDAIIVDSIQTVFSEKIESAPGSVSQVREVAGQMMIFAKASGTPVFLIGHVTKEGSIAGPKALEHMWTRFYILKATASQSPHYPRHEKPFRRGKRNRHFRDDERRLIAGRQSVGSFFAGTTRRRERFGRDGLYGRHAPDARRSSGSGERDEIRHGRRMAQGFDYNRTSLLIAVLEKRLGFQLAGRRRFRQRRGRFGN